ncbi:MULTISPECIES: heme-binding protein [unclassified Cryobacterium]|uniref:SOUL family heme-binding protein n=1 Tax=unclassified Cryobacterium TaxID=2649013 RepID=UPI00106C1908|nr:MULTISPECIES: heme-binding protein [unclassified Cryobacterium]TFC50360.1 heme-binding protein [Cryobacterium sp. TMB3-1-2]TFC71905.1 heme-binding protein [Cryobacterium sp. TMB3-15]TFC78498.1 heme-binding protein [Cryobacterium sp. TMB3-10]TFD44555.1 heme-binding protein [Cryobacterium sp. TMB3-12]
MTEKQPYDSVQRYDDFEVRRYPGHVLAEIVVGGPFDEAGNRAFRSLFAYISGENVSRTKVAMTAPVVQDAAGSRIAMTAPVVQEPVDAGDAADGGYRVAFVLPASLTIDSAPRPTNSEVHLRAVPEALVAVIRYRGRWTQDSYTRHLDELRQAISAAGLTPVGPPRFARYDPPFKPAFLRRNEVLINVNAS